MAVTIEGVRIKNISISREEEGKLKVSGVYELVSSAGAVLARQGFNSGYNDLTMNQSVVTTKLVHEILQSMTNDINATMGLS